MYSSIGLTTGGHLLRQVETLGQRLVLSLLEINGLHEPAEDQVELLPVEILWVPDILDLREAEHRTINQVHYGL